MADVILPDVLDQGLSVVFCGTAVGNSSAALGAYYAHPNNRFWSILHETGLTNIKLKPHEYQDTRRFGIGLTDLCKHASGLDNEIPKVTKEDREALKRKIETYKPKFLAFTSKEAGRRFFGHSPNLGEHTEAIGDSKVFILPSTSPMAAWQWKDTSVHWYRLAKAVAALKDMGAA
jgi:TDG/mug DNA glycosylase family protein